MSSNIENHKNCLSSVRPLLKNKKISLDLLKDKLEEKNKEYNKYKIVYDEKYFKKNELLKKIDTIAKSGEVLDVNILTNAKYYLLEVNEELIEVSTTLRSKKQAVDKVNAQLTECHVDVKLMEDYEKKKNIEFRLEIEKYENQQLEDLWLQNKLNKYLAGEIIND